MPHWDEASTAPPNCLNVLHGWYYRLLEVICSRWWRWIRWCTLWIKCIWIKNVSWLTCNVIIFIVLALFAIVFDTPTVLNSYKIPTVNRTCGTANPDLLLCRILIKLQHHIITILISTCVVYSFFSSWYGGLAASVYMFSVFACNSAPSAYCSIHSLLPSSQHSFPWNNNQKLLVQKAFVNNSGLILFAAVGRN